MALGLTGSYVTALEEKIRQLESRIGSGEFGGQNATSPENETQDLNEESGFPLSPTSVKDVLELDDSQSFEVLEFGRHPSTSPLIDRRRLVILGSQ